MKWVEILFKTEREAQTFLMETTKYLLTWKYYRIKSRFKMDYMKVINNNDELLYSFF